MWCVWLWFLFLFFMSKIIEAVMVACRCGVCWFFFLLFHIVILSGFVGWLVHIVVDCRLVVRFLLLLFFLGDGVVIGFLMIRRLGLLLLYLCFNEIMVAWHSVWLLLFLFFRLIRVFVMAVGIGSRSIVIGLMDWDVWVVHKSVSWLFQEVFNSLTFLPDGVVKPLISLLSKVVKAHAQIVKLLTVVERHVHVCIDGCNESFPLGLVVFNQGGSRLSDTIDKVLCQPPDSTEEFFLLCIRRVEKCLLIMRRDVVIDLTEGM